MSFFTWKRDTSAAVGSRTANVLVAVSPTQAVIPPKGRAAQVTTAVLPLHAVRLRGLEWASGTDVSRYRGFGFTLTALGVGFVPAQLELSCSTPSLKQPFQISLP